MPWYSEKGELCVYVCVCITNMFSLILLQIDEFEHTASGWRLKSVINLVVAVNKYTPLGGGSASSSFIRLPKELETNPNIVNVQNTTDNFCFLWCILASLHPPTGHPASPSSYPQDLDARFNLKGITFPITLNSIEKFERQNTDISINVFGVDKKGVLVGPYYHTKNVKRNHVNLLMLTQGNGVTQRLHYCLIKNLGKLCRKTHFGKNAVEVCDRCLNHFYSIEKLQQHSERCENHKACTTRVPEVGSDDAIVKFRNFKALLRVGYVMYADFECLTTKIENDRDRATKAYQKHVPYSCGYNVVCSYDDKLSHYEQSPRGVDPASWFVDQLRRESARIKEALGNRNVVMRPLSLIEELNHLAKLNCEVCLEPFTPDNCKVHHHDHLTGEYLGALCNNCNLQVQIPNFVPVFFHNLSRYDSHLLIRALNFDKEEIRIIASTTEVYISFIRDMGDGIQFRFLDSFRFMNRSLGELASNLKSDQMKQVKKHYPTPEHFLLATRKGVFPYDYLCEAAKLDETVLPSIEEFYSKLKDESISQYEYEHAQKVWDTFNIKTLGQYSDLYMKIDVLLLSDIFENFRDLTMKIYGLDAVCFFTAPGLSFSAALKVTGIRLQLLTDIDMVLFFEGAIRGGLTQASLRYVEANNKFMNTFDDSKPVNYLLYIDANNLYGWASNQALPTHGFVWMSEEEVHECERALGVCKWLPYDEDDDESCVFEVDLVYPECLHDFHSDLPFCPTHRVSPEGINEKKLIASLHPPQKYILHYRNLKQALEHGLKLVRIHRGIKFNQRPWLKQFIMKNTELRTRASNDFEKDFYKLMNNANFGKNIENVRHYRDIKLASNWESARKYISNPRFKSSTIFGENLIAIELSPKEIYFNKPLYVGMSILDLSKILMYRFHYDYIKTLDKEFLSKLCYMDTDSFIYSFSPKIEELSIYDILKRDALKWFDTSDYADDNIFGIPQVNKKVIGMMKDELKGGIMSHFIALRSKMYAYKVDGITKKKLKGVGESAVRKITFEDYKQALFGGTPLYTSFNTIRSHKHVIYSETVSKLALDANDDKRKICEDNVHTIPWGHYSTINNNNKVENKLKM